jgi:hypothetical protein
MDEFNEWESFYLLVGGAAGALIGLQFVVMTLIAERPPARAAEANSAFGTPTIVHFCAALLLSAFLRAPWHATLFPSILWGLTGVGGVAYVLIVARRMYKQTAYRPDAEDWSFHVVVPAALYALLAASAFAASSYTREALFCVGACTLGLLLLSIRNAYDSVAFLVLRAAAAINADDDKNPEKKKG